MGNKWALFLGVMAITGWSCVAYSAQKQKAEIAAEMHNFIEETRKILNLDRDHPGLGNRLEKAGDLECIAQYMQQTIVDYHTWYLQEIGWYHFVPLAPVREKIIAKRQDYARHAAQFCAPIMNCDAAEYQYPLFALAEKHFKQPYLWLSLLTPVLCAGKDDADHT